MRCLNGSGPSSGFKTAIFWQKRIGTSSPFHSLRCTKTLDVFVERLSRSVEFQKNHPR